MPGLLSAPVAAPSLPAGSGLLPPSQPVQSPQGSTQPPEGYFYAKDPKTGAAIGVSDKSDPYSGRPYFAYRTAGANATTTDSTRIGTTFDPRVAQPELDSAFTNPRMPESASQAIRTKEGATSEEQLDHGMALAVGGSNDPENLRLISTKENQAASGNEGQFQKDVSAGKESLFQAQAEEAADKGLPAPFTDYTTHVAHAFNLLDYLKGAFEKLPSELAGIKNPF